MKLQIEKICGTKSCWYEVTPKNKMLNILSKFPINQNAFYSTLKEARIHVKKGKEFTKEIVK